MKSFFIRTFGCQMNYSDSEKLEAVLLSLGLEKKEYMKDADLVVYNTCSIKQHAEQRVYGAVYNAKKLGKTVALTGCMVRKTSTKYDEREEMDSLLRRFVRIDLVFRIEDMQCLPELLQKFDSSLARPSIPFNELDYLNITPNLSQPHRAFVPIMTGCDKFCTYCIVPFTRGRERSRPFSDIMEECQKHIQNGVKEIVLVGQNVNAYFLDDTTRKTLQRQTDFALLLEAVAALPIARLTFTSPHPRHMGQDVLEVMQKYPNILRTIHLPVQSGSSSQLQKMGREHNITRFTDFTALARKMIPEITITTDIIVGFCDETEEDFAMTMDLFDQEQFLIAYISKYSPRKGTFSGDKMEDSISEEIKKERLARLTEKLKETSRNEYAKMLGKAETVLVDSVENGFAEGKTHTNRIVRFPIGVRNEKFIGQIIPVKITKTSDWAMEGEIMNM